jgi:hypothetical protein
LSALPTSNGKPEELARSSGDKHRLGARWGVLTRALGKWRLFKEITPGHRFQTRYNNKRQRRERGGTSRYGWMVNLIGGLALIAAGFAFIPTPGPSNIIVVIGMWMLAGEFLLLARLFDRLEVRLRELGRWIRDRWNTLPTPVKALVVLVGVAASGYGIFCLILGS